MARLRSAESAGPFWPPDRSWPERLRVFRREDWPASCDELALADWVSAQVAFLPTTKARLAAIRAMTPSKPG
ncbi:hypothetical protein H7J50_04530 [Mycobacterium intermedium]|nr:hypothetical protein [Mycobacterium intermedium]MCV6963075.1 hypothetical protein [Mycobacterium intermedium]